MKLAQERAEIVAYARRMESDGLALGTAGNLSVRGGDVVAVTPSAVPYRELSQARVCLVSLDGEVVEGPSKPTTELPMHLAAYRTTDATAVVHTHSPFATTVSTVFDELPAVHYMIAALGGPVRVAPYFTPGTYELADAVASALKERSAVILQNHGALVTGPSLDVAYAGARLLEWLCAVYYRARVLGEPRILTEDELRDFAERLRDYGA